MPQPVFESLLDVAAQIESKDRSPVEVVQETLDRATRLGPVFNAYITIMAEEALAAAKEADREILSGQYRGPLHGIPLSIKDIYWTKGIRTTAGSRVLSHFVPDEDSAVVERLRAAGAILIAKANTYQFACSPPIPEFGATRNPWDLTKTTRGSSCGSAAGVSAGIEFGSFGSDTGGSIRVPSAFTGIAGLKPSNGNVPTLHMQTVSPTLDCAGPMARTVADVRALYSAVAATGPPEKPSEQLDLRDIHIGILSEGLADPTEAGVAGPVRQMGDVFKDAGAHVSVISIPDFIDPALDAHTTIMWAEDAHTHREMFKHHRDEYSEFLQVRLDEGNKIPATTYIAAMEHRAQLRERMQETMKEWDALLLPTSPFPATDLERADGGLDLDRTDELVALGRFNSPFNLTGQPALSVPAGHTDEGLPIGVQIVGREGEDQLVIQLGSLYQQITSWHNIHPPAETWAN